MIRLDGGEFLMGSTDRLSYPDDGEGPLRRVRVDPFQVEPSAVTNADFARFVDGTGHVTDAERYGCPSCSPASSQMTFLRPGE